MKSIFLSAVLAFTALSMQAQTIKSLAIGAKIPEARKMLRSTTGKEISLNTAKTSEGLLVMFSCNTCPYVIKSQARTLVAMKVAQRAGVGMVIINSNEAQRSDADSYAAMQQYAQEQKYTVPYVMDEQSKLADAFGATRTPEVFLFDKNGRLVYKGAMEDNPAEPEKSKSLFLNQAIMEMKSGKAITTAETKSIGCSIKRAS